MFLPSMHCVWQAFLGCFWAGIEREWPHYAECGIGLCNPPPSMEQYQARSFPFSSSFLFLQVHTLWPTQRRSGFPLCLKREEEKCPRVCRDDLQFSPAEADRMRLWAVPLPSMLLLFKMKRRLRKGRTTRTEMCLAVSARTLSSWPGSSRPFSLWWQWVTWLILVFRRWVKVVARLEWNQCRSFFPIVGLYCLLREAWGGSITEVFIQEFTFNLRNRRGLVSLHQAMPCVLWWVTTEKTSWEWSEWRLVNENEGVL